MSRKILRLFPTARRGWGEAYLADFGLGPGLIKVFIHAWYLQLKGGNIMKTVVITSSVINVAFGLFVTGLFIFTGDNPGVVLVIGLAMIIQGTYTLAYATDRLASGEPWVTRILLSGQTVALVVGMGAGLITVIENLTIDAGEHHEYGPMAVAGLIAFQALVTLYLYAVRESLTDISRPETN